MPKTPVELKIGSVEHSALKRLSKIKGLPIDALVKVAIRCYVIQQKSAPDNLDAAVAGLRHYRQKQSKLSLQEEIATVAEAESKFKDPLEGHPVRGRFVGGKFRPTGSVQSKLGKLLRA